jgi:hypothetical protein
MMQCSLTTKKIDMLLLSIISANANRPKHGATNKTGPRSISNN